MLLALLLLAATAFEDTSTCYVRGYVYNMAEEVSFKRDDLCRVDGELTAGKLVLWSRWYWVAIPVPETKSQTVWWYRWGSAVAHVGGQDVRVEWGRSTRG